MTDKKNRKAAQRERDKQLGFVRAKLRIEAEEMTQLDELCALLRPGYEPYTRSELIGLMVRKTRKEYEEKLSTIPACRKCGEPAPVAECALSGDSQCWRYYGPSELYLKI
ncbi:hypothetical protein EKL29_21320 [Pantoea sp. YU22]|uniref:hypothetical protein n=1 Tax=Pantoea sp. YU22 TaxID=2497684 RepID=UPI000F86FCE2|nr:hypothetical protein [Pantoea sp. YU22]RTY53661.1 hypothetical protein EKL29_21320 [Pantoea sp. YU22]